MQYDNTINIMQPGLDAAKFGAGIEGRGHAVVAFPAQRLGGQQGGIGQHVSLNLIYHRLTHGLICDFHERRPRVSRGAGGESGCESNR